MKRAWIKRGSSRMRAHGTNMRRKRRDAMAREGEQAFRDAVLVAAGADPETRMGNCQRCREHRKLEAHHMKRNPRVHDPEFGRALCWYCHRIDIHDHQGSDWRLWFA